MGVKESEGISSQPRLFTVAAYARSKSISKQRIHTLVAEGRIILEDGKINPATADVILAEGVDPRYPDPTKPQPRTPNAIRLLEAKAAKEETRARIEQLDLEARLGKVIDRALAIEAFTTLTRITRDALLNAAPAFAMKATVVKDRKAMRALYEATVKKALGGLTPEKLDEQLRGDDDNPE